MGTKVYSSYVKTETLSHGTSTEYSNIRSYIDYSVVKNNDTQYQLSIGAGMEGKGIGAPRTHEYISLKLEVTDNTSKTGSSSRPRFLTTGSVYDLIASANYPVWTKGHSSKTIKVAITNAACPRTETSLNISKTFTIPAKKSYTVAYNANGGTNAPTSQTKWYGESLTLQKGKPTKADSTTGLLYDFTGWNTKADGTGTMYQPGAVYTGNDALTLYAQWEPHYYPPVIKHYDVTRCDQNGNPEDEGKYAKVTFDCVINRWKHSDNTTLSAASVSIGSYTATPTITYSTDGYDTVCTCSAIVGDGSFDTDATYSGSISVTDSSTGETMSTATMSIVLNSAKFAIDMSANGRSIGIFKPASDTEDYLLDVGGKIDISGTPYNSSWVQQRDFAQIKRSTIPNSNGMFPFVDAKTPSGDWAIATYGEGFYVSYVTDVDYDSGTNTQTAVLSISNSGAVNASGQYQVHGRPYISTELKSWDNVTIAKGAFSQFSYSVEKAGYTPIGVAGFDIDSASSSGTQVNNVWFGACRLSGNNVIFQLRNHNDSTAAKVKLWAAILYRAT